MLCFRCEIRAQYLEEKVSDKDAHAPRYECGNVESAVCSCYMFKPTMPVAVAPNQGDGRSLFTGWMMAARVHAVDTINPPVLDAIKISAKDGKKRCKGWLLFWNPKKVKRKKDV